MITNNKNPKSIKQKRDKELWQLCLVKQMHTITYLTKYIYIQRPIRNILKSPLVQSQTVACA